MKENQPIEIAVVGLGAGGLYASKSALGHNRKCRVTILEKRTFDQFSPCGLPFAIGGVVKDFEDLKYQVPEVKNRMVKLLGHEVVSVDKDKKLIRVVDLVSYVAERLPAGAAADEDDRVVLRAADRLRIHVPVCRPGEPHCRLPRGASVGGGHIVGRHGSARRVGVVGPGHVHAGATHE